MIHLPDTKALIRVRTRAVAGERERGRAAPLLMNAPLSQSPSLPLSLRPQVRRDSMKSEHVASL